MLPIYKCKAYSKKISRKYEVAKLKAFVKSAYPDDNATLSEFMASLFVSKKKASEAISDLIYIAECQSAYTLHIAKQPLLAHCDLMHKDGN